jgi:pimeloyl-ACP methyl ester carboxylesterase
MRSFSSLMGWASALLVLAACGDDSGVTGGATSGGGGSGGEPAGGNDTGGSGGLGAGGNGGEGGAGAVNWSPCPVSSDESFGGGAECATIKVPLDWSDPDGPKIDFFVKRLPAVMQPSRGQLWFLNGGPGYSGADYDNFTKAQTIDLYLPDHRGTGRSSRLGCPTYESDESEGGFNLSQAELPGCVDELIDTWGEGLKGFTITNAARDVGEFIEATKRPEDDILVYGGSYGTIWANRLMVLYPGQETGVILDAPAMGGELDLLDVWMNELGHDFMDRCGADSVCSQKLGADPWATMTQTLNDFDAGACPEIEALGFDRRFLQQIWGSFFYRWDLRPFLPPMVYRLNRCSEADIAAYENFATAISQPAPATASQRYFSLMLSANIQLSELWNDPAPTVAELSAFRDTANVVQSLPEVFASMAPDWPRYPLDEYFGVSAGTSTPILSMHGEFDFIPQEVSDAAIAPFTGPNQTYVTIPRAPHGTFQAPSVGGGPSCANQLFSQFIANPTATIDSSCTDQVAPLELAPPAALSNALFGTNDPWEGVP